MIYRNSIFTQAGIIDEEWSCLVALEKNHAHCLGFRTADLILNDK
jgi:hypothetical protein